MSKLVFDKAGQRFYETGVKNVALFLQNVSETDGAVSYPKGVAWNGVTAFTESPSGAEATPLYADDIKYLNLMSKEEFGATLEAYTYPDEFAVCDGSAELTAGVKIGQQPRKSFGLAVITTAGNDTDGNAYGEKLHLIYGCLAAPSERSYATINDSPEAITFSWEISTTPVEVEGHEPTSIVTIDKVKVGAKKWEAIINKVYGSENSEAALPLPNEIVELLNSVTE